MSDQSEPMVPSETPASEFRRVRVEGERITIRSTGRVVRMRVIKPRYLLALGTIPDPLSELVMSLLHGTLKAGEWRAFFAMPERKEQTIDMLESLRVVCMAALVHPRIVDEPSADDEIHIDDLQDNEQRVIFELALMEATGLSRFRAKQESGLDIVEQLAADAVQAE